MKATIGKDSTILLGAKFDCVGGLEVGAGSIINQNCRLDARGGLKIGSSVQVSSDTIILTADHDLNSPTFDGRQARVVIEDFAFIGTRAMILKGVTINKGGSVAAGSVVTKDVDSYQVVGGVPAKPITTRNQNLNYSCRYFRLLW